MMFIARTPSVAILLAIALASTTLAADAAKFRAGFAERDITPDIGMEQPGGYGKAFHKTRHDACKVRASVFDDGTKRVAIVGIDALLIRRPTIAAARRAIQEKCGIPPDAVMIAASHSHSAGPTGMILPGEFDHDSDLVKSLAYEKSSTADAAYLERVEQAIIDAVVEADKNKVAARCGVGVGIEDKVAFNRRFRMAGGHTMTHPGQGNPDILEPAGPTDPQVGVVGAWNEEGKFLGCIVNFCCHATTGPGGISADYIHYVEKTIRGLLGDDAIVVFVPGMAGDVTQVDNRSPFAIKQFGESLGAVCRRTRRRRGAEGSAGHGASRRIARAGRVRDADAADSATQAAPERLAARASWFRKIHKRWTPPNGLSPRRSCCSMPASREPIADVEVQAVQIGPAVFVSCPAEYFCQYGLDIKAGSRFPFTFPVSLANDCVGYVPTEEALGPRGGGYETRLTSYSNLEPTAGRKIADAAIELTSHLAPGTIPQPAPLPPFVGKPWTYGSLPPELD